MYVNVCALLILWETLIVQFLNMNNTDVSQHILFVNVVISVNRYIYGW